jgi:amino acid permease
MKSEGGLKSENLIEDPNPTNGKNQNPKLVYKSYSNPSKSMLDRLDKTRELPCYKRVFRSIGPGSLRGAIINFIRMTTGIGIMALPLYLSKFGIFFGVIFLILSGVLTYNAFMFNFEAQAISKKNQLVDIVKFFMPTWVVKIFKVTIMLDLLCTPIVYVVMGWNIFNYILYIFGQFKQNWIIDPYKLLFNDYDPLLFIVRIVFLHIVFILLIPLYLKKTLESLKIVSQMFLGIFVLLIIIIFIQAPWYYQKYHHPDDSQDKTDVLMFKSLNDLSCLKYGFSILLAYYGQPYVFPIRNQLIQPSMRRLKKISRMNLFTNLVIYTSFAVVGYYVWGDKYTPALMILRKSIDSAPVLEIIFRIALVLFFILIFIGTASFNPTLRDAFIKAFLIKGKISFR